MHTHIYVYAPFFGFPSHLGHHRALSRVPWGSCVCVCTVIQAYPVLFSPIDCSLPGAYAHGLFQARVLKWIAISYSRGSSWPRGWTPISYGLVIHSSFLSVNSYLHSISGMFMWVPVSQFIPASLYPLGVHVFLLYVCISFCFVNKSICILFLDSVYKWYYMVCVFLFLTYFTLYESL